MAISAGAVLVGYDGSSDSELALSWADEMARLTQHPIRVLISEVDLTRVLEVTSDWHTARMTLLDADARDRLKESTAPGISVEVVPGPPTRVLVDASRESWLLVVGARGHSLLSGILLGSVSQHLARHAACPVVVVREPHDPQPRVVVGVDGSKGSEGALEFAAAQADRSGSALVAVHARPLSRIVRPLERSHREEVAVGERVVAEAVAGLEQSYPDLEIVTQAIPEPASRCLAGASYSASMVVVGSRGRGAFAGMLLGSVTQHVLHQAGCPVAVVR